jgi:hypothetical protein
MSLTVNYLKNQIGEIGYSYDSKEAIYEMFFQLFEGSIYDLTFKHLSHDDNMKELNILFSVFLLDPSFQFHFSLKNMDIKQKNLLIDNFFNFDNSTQFSLLARSDIVNYLDKESLNQIKRQDIVLFDNGLKLSNYAFYKNMPSLKHIDMEGQRKFYFPLTLILDTLEHDMDSSFLYQKIHTQFNDEEKLLMGQCFIDNYLPTRFDIKRLTEIQKLLNYTPYISNIFEHYSLLDELMQEHTSLDAKNTLLDYLTLNLDKKEAREGIFHSFGYLHSQIKIENPLYLKIFKLLFYCDNDLSDREIISLFLNQKDKHQDLLLRGFDYYASTEEKNFILYDKAIIDLEKFCLEHNENIQTEKMTFKKIKL